MGLLIEASVCYIHAVSLPSGSSPPPAKEPVTAVTANSSMTAAAQLQNSDAFAAVAQLFQSSQGQQVGLRWLCPQLIYLYYLCLHTF